MTANAIFKHVKEQRNEKSEGEKAVPKLCFERNRQEEVRFEEALHKEQYDFISPFSVPHLIMALVLRCSKIYPETTSGTLSGFLLLLVTARRQKTENYRAKALPAYSTSSWRRRTKRQLQWRTVLLLWCQTFPHPRSNDWPLKKNISTTCNLFQ